MVGCVGRSDRREDFRTEILGLMKAQQVKNTIIVPSGSKGGFVCKQLPSGGREAIQAEVIACYKTFVSGLLDVTDNIVGDRIVPPEQVVRRDEDDPYLVVAADKGTATFSDIANDISAEYGFWLGDAFASGGSAGYDHKKMGITARGAWESVKRHFRELGTDVENEPFTVVGIGDMAGDVFGNGMLLSKHIKLVAAFNHLHIFLDPDPDPAASFAERDRLFSLPRSSWGDYDAATLSKGGGVYSRQTKSIELHPAAQAMLGIEESKLTPLELIRAILRMQADLLWNGGIGTYVKASSESHVDAGDPANDAVRVNADELNCKVVGEGGNLGITQLGRIEFALAGGLVNSDFIDNSAGVDSSDHEVNIKILLDEVIRRRRLPRSERRRLLAQMTSTVAKLVLRNNYAQTQALSVLDTHSFERLGENARLIRTLETKVQMDRALEFLPSDETIAERRSIGKGLTRPELAVLFSYAKIGLTNQLMASKILDDAYYDETLETYFPPRLQKRFAPSMRVHQLRREIIAMRIANDLVNRMGPAFTYRTIEDTAASVSQVVRAYTIVRDVFDIGPIWNAIEAADYKVPPPLQYELIFQISRLVRRAVYWLLQQHPVDRASHQATDLE
ncbi:MAG: NAD-glutamate dehydrogenase, partial [Gammaproteobacteria bacterium]|nr:NAD-glutamate dehydrogenase [Gammaproteobacteria bacterium]